MTTFAELWNAAASEPKKSFENVVFPEGDYKAEIMSVKLGPTKLGDKDMFSWDLKVIDGEYSNNHMFVNRSFSKTDMSDQNKNALIRALDDFKALNMQCDTANLNNSMKSLIGKKIEVRIKNGTKEGTQFTNFLRLIQDKPAAPATSGAEQFGGTVSGEEVPF